MRKKDEGMMVLRVWACTKCKPRAITGQEGMLRSRGVWGKMKGLAVTTLGFETSRRHAQT